MEKQTKKVKEVRYEIPMYKLLTITIIGLFVAIGVGFVLGNIVGQSQGVDKVTAEVPEYCHINKVGTEIKVECTELSNITAGDLCRMLSTPLENKIRVLIVQ